MDFIELGTEARWESSPGHLAQKSMEELCHFGGGEENNSLGECGVGELIVGEQTKDMRKLIRRRGKDSMVLRDVSVDRRIFRCTVDEDMVLV